MKTRHRPVMVKLPTGIKVKVVRVGFKFAVAVTTDGRVLTWGDGLAGDLGTGKCKPSDVPVFAALPPERRSPRWPPAPTASLP